PLVLLELHEGGAPALTEPLDLPAPFLEVRQGVALVAQPQVAPVASRFHRRGGLLRVGDAESGVDPAEPLVDVVGEPALVAELEGMAPAGGKLVEEPAQASPGLLA